MLSAPCDANKAVRIFLYQLSRTDYVGPFIPSGAQRESVAGASLLKPSLHSEVPHRPHTACILCFKVSPRSVFTSLYSCHVAQRCPSGHELGILVQAETSRRARGVALSLLHPELVSPLLGLLVLNPPPWVSPRLGDWRFQLFVTCPLPSFLPLPLLSDTKMAVALAVGVLF